MHPIIESMETKNLALFTQLLNEHPEYLNEVDDGWSLLPIATYSNLTDFAQVLLDKMTPEQVNLQVPEHPLHIAFDNNAEEMIRLLVNHEKTDLNLLSTNGDNLLYYASYFGHEDIIPDLVKHGVSPFASNNSGKMPILFAIEKGNDEAFDLYSKDNDFDINYEDLWIKLSIKHNNLHIFKALQPYSNLSSDELFNLAADFGHVQIVDTILDSGEMIPGQEQITKIIDLMCLQYEEIKDSEAALRLADFLFDINVPFNRFVNSAGESAWILAINNDNQVIFDKLINTNESINIVDNDEYTPLFYAIENHNEKFVASILKKRPNLNHRDKKKNTALIQCVRYGLTDSVLEMLKYNNGFVNEVNSEGETALNLAIIHKRLDMITALIWAGAEITTNPARFIENNPVYQIGLNGTYEKAYDGIDEKVVDSFVALNKMGLKLDQLNEKGDSLLLHFIKNGYLANFKAMLRCTVDINQVDKDGNSALMCAMRKNNDDYAIALLLRFDNIDYSLTNQDGENIYDLAAECNSFERVLLLIKNDEHLTLDNLKKVLPLISLSGSFKELYEVLENSPIIAELENELGDYLNSHGNNMLMLSVMGNNIENFNFLLENSNIHFNHFTKNKKEENIVDIIRKIPEQDGLLFAQTIKPYLVKQKKSPK